MEGGGAQGGAGIGGPAPFLLKTYDMVDDTSTDEIVSWSSNNSSFVVWNPPEFSRLLLPTYFKHSNFSSFIRQLNTYGFRKIDPERWEFSNDGFVKGKKHLLKNIHRRKPIHSHSNPPASSGSDPERASLEEEIERLSREKTAFEADLWRFRNQHTGTKSQLEELERKVKDMEQRQQKMMAFLWKASESPVFVEHLVRMAGGASIDFSVLSNKRRQLPRDGAERGQERIDNRPSDDYSSSSKASEFGHLFPQDFTSKLKLELSPAVSDGNLASLNTQSSDEGAGSPRGRQLEGIQLRTACLSFVPEVAEMMDSGASLCPRKNLPLPWQAGAPDEADGNISCHLNLTLASCPLQFEKSLSTEKRLNSTSQDIIDCVAKLRSNTTDSERDFSEVVKNDKPNGGSGDAKEAASLQEPVTANNPVMAPATGKNDVFWEQFLTERPGSSDTEEASSRLRSNPQEERYEGGNDTSWCSRKGIEKLSL